MLLSFLIQDVLGAVIAANGEWKRLLSSYPGGPQRVSFWLGYQFACCNMFHFRLKAASWEAIITHGLIRKEASLFLICDSSSCTYFLAFLGQLCERTFKQAANITALQCIDKAFFELNMARKYALEDLDAFQKRNSCRCRCQISYQKLEQQIRKIGNAVCFPLNILNRRRCHHILGIPHFFEKDGRCSLIYSGNTSKEMFAVWNGTFQRRNVSYILAWEIAL